MATPIGIIQTSNRQPSHERWAEESNPAMAALLGLAVDETQSQGAYVYSFNPAAGPARLAGWAGLPPADGALPEEVPPGAARLHLGRSAPVVVREQAWSDARFEALPEFAKNRFEGVASIPLLESGTVIGLMNVCRSHRVSLQGSALSFLLSLSVPVSALVAGEAARARLLQSVGARAKPCVTAFPGAGCACSEFHPPCNGLRGRDDVVARRRRGVSN